MKNKKSIIFLIIILIILAIMAGGLFIYKKLNKGQVEETINNVEDIEDEEPLIVQPKQVKTFNGDDRPISVMIDNHSGAWPQANLNKAYIVYEIIVEGGETRLMALFKGQDLDKIGPVRSSRHYFLDYALENDAIYVHHGYSPQAREDWSKLGVDRIEVNESTTGWRDKSASKTYEFTLFTNIEKLGKGIRSKRTERNKDLLLNYSVDNIDISQMEGAIPANKIDIKYSSNTTTNYKYDTDNNIYLRSVNNKSQNDYVTGKQLTVKNIIVYKVKYSNIQGDDKGRQTIDNVGNGTGYYISNGYAVPITWKKDSRSSATIYKYNNGKEIQVNDGNTFIQIMPDNQTLAIS